LNVARKLWQQALHPIPPFFICEFILFIYELAKFTKLEKEISDCCRFFYELEMPSSIEID